MTDDGHTINLGPVTVGETLRTAGVGTVDIDRIEERAAVALAAGYPQAFGVDPGDVLALVAVVRAADQLARVYALHEWFSGVPVDSPAHAATRCRVCELFDALAPFREDTDG